jgi:hypothetical protein
VQIQNYIFNNNNRDGDSRMTLLIRSVFVLVLSGVWGTANAALIQNADIVSVDGREWTQPDLFLNLTWADISTVCPGGVCGAGSLNGFDMAGWIWAGADSLNQLFNHYIGSNAMGPGPDSYTISGNTAPAENGFFGAGGFRETDFTDDFLGEPAGSALGRMADSDDYLARVLYIDGISGLLVPLVGNNFYTSLPNTDLYTHDPIDNSPLNIGAWFYRDAPAQAPLPSSTWLLAAALLAWRASARRPLWDQ